MNPITSLAHTNRVTACVGQHDKDKQQQKPTTKSVKGKAVLATADTTPMANRFAILNDDVA